MNSTYVHESLKVRTALRPLLSTWLSPSSTGLRTLLKPSLDINIAASYHLKRVSHYSNRVGVVFTRVWNCNSLNPLKSRPFWSDHSKRLMASDGWTNRSHICRAVVRRQYLHLHRCCCGGGSVRTRKRYHVTGFAYRFDDPLSSSSHRLSAPETAWAGLCWRQELRSFTTAFARVTCFAITYAT